MRCRNGIIAATIAAVVIIGWLAHRERQDRIIARWGNPYNYEYPSSKNPNRDRPAIWSNGPNGKNEQGAGDDINNWGRSDEGWRFPVFVKVCGWIIGLTIFGWGLQAILSAFRNHPDSTDDRTNRTVRFNALKMTPVGILACSLFAIGLGCVITVRTFFYGMTDYEGIRLTLIIVFAIIGFPLVWLTELLPLDTPLSVTAPLALTLLAGNSYLWASCILRIRKLHRTKNEKT